MTAKDEGESRGSTIILIGFRGSGKTTVGRELAALLQVDLADTDEEITRDAGMSITELFGIEGEAGFRRREREAVARVAGSRPGVICVGGGAVCDERNVEALRRAGTLVWLTAPPAVLWQRIQADRTSMHSRPPLTALAALAEVEQLLAARKADYENAADLTIDTAGRSPAEIAREIVKLLG